MSQPLWNELKFPPLNLWVMPRHDVLIYAHAETLDPMMWDKELNKPSKITSGESNVIYL